MNSELTKINVDIRVDLSKKVDEEFLKWLGVETMDEAIEFVRVLGTRDFTVNVDFGQPVFTRSSATVRGDFKYVVEQDVKFSIRKVGE